MKHVWQWFWMAALGALAGLLVAVTTLANVWGFQGEGCWSTLLGACYAEPSRLIAAHVLVFTLAVATLYPVVVAGQWLRSAYRQSVQSAITGFISRLADVAGS